MTKPIAGQYFLDEDRAAICTRCEESGEIITLAMFTDWSEQDRADAQLMIAAPKLLAACRKAEELLAPWQETGLLGEQALDLVRAAIAEAEGRS